uniref:Xanthine dehydrogenase n=1 Tax=Parascaris univalens TaxID=6257 RepID=A0A914ZT67_PARUN
MGYRNNVRFFVNGREVVVENPDPESTLAYFLRENLNLTGTKIGCEEGVCGACTVVVGRWDCQQQKAIYRAANACLLPLFLVDRCSIQTIEGIGSAKRMHSIQERLSRGHGTQCGFCSPGFVMSLYALLRNSPHPSTDEIDEAIRGNLCRCTGYRPILESFYSLSRDGCCQQYKDGCACRKAQQFAAETERMTSLTNFADFPSYDPSQEPIFPPQLILDARNEDDDILQLHGRRIDLLAPKSLSELTIIYQENGKNTRLVSSGLITRLVHSFNRSEDRVSWLSIHRIPVLKAWSTGAKDIRIGSGLSISDFLDVLKARNDDGYFDPILEMFAKYSSIQVRNTASWSGALCSASASSEFCTLALALAFCIEVLSLKTGEKRMILIDKTFFNDMNGPKTTLKSDDVIIQLIVPKLSKVDRILTFKIGARHGGDSTELNAVGKFVTDDNRQHIESAKIAIGGVGRRPWLAENTANSLIGRSLSVDDEALLTDTFAVFDKELDQIPHQQNDAQMEHRKALARSALFKFMVSLIHNQKVESMPVARSTILQAQQIYNRVPSSQNISDAVGRPVPHQSGDVHVTGEAKYTADIKVADMLHLALVQSTEAHAEILSIDPSAALRIPGVVDYVDVRDIPPGGTNTPGIDGKTIMADDSPIFANGTVEAVGQPIGAIVAVDVETARRAAKLVKVDYKRLKPIVTIRDAIENGSFHVSSDPREFLRDWSEEEDYFKECRFIAEGDVVLGAQEHVYMETQSAVCVPEENDEWLIYTSSQMAAFAQLHCASILGIPKNKIVLKTKRIGGGFGGKTLGQCGCARNTALIAANKLKRPVKCALSRREDFLATGTRHPMEAHYKIACDNDGHLIAADFTSYINGGYTIDNSFMVATLLSMNADSCYRIPHMRCRCYPCKTNIASNTAMRGYGTPQSSFLIEMAISHLADKAQIDPIKFREINHANKGWIRLNGDIIRNDNLTDCWQQCKMISRIDELQKEVNEFNSTHRYLKRGLAMSAVRFGLTHAGNSEQSFALVQIYLDGSVSVSIGGIEMGQGLFTKCIQVASRVLDIPVTKITMLGASTDKTANAPVTGGSQGADVHGTAVKAACEVLADRLEPIKREFPDGTFESWVWTAYDRQIGLSAAVHKTIPRQEIGMPKGATYFTTGAATTIAEIDALTGEHRIISVDIVMDCGDTLSPAIDVGQIEGGFMQGYGLYTMEEYQYANNGTLITDSLGKYKIPTADVVPEKIRITLLKESDSHSGMVYSSKGIGEPPLLLGICPMLAICEAINAFRSDTGRRSTFIARESPLTALRIRKACDAKLPFNE